MPLPDEQARALKAELDNHERNISKIRKSIQNLQAELLVHETLLAMGRNPKLIEVLNDMYDHPELAGKVADLASYLADKNITLPPGTTISVIKSDSHSIVGEAHFKLGGFDYKGQWDSNKGFSVDVVDQRAQ
jgi:hypothetical protein